MEKDISQYKKVYPGISGIFLDEGSSWVCTCLACCAFLTASRVDDLDLSVYVQPQHMQCQAHHKLLSSLAAGHNGGGPCHSHTYCNVH